MDKIESKHVLLFIAIALLLFVAALFLSLNGTASNAWRLLATPTDSTLTSSPSGLEIITSNGFDELTLLRGCSETQLLKMNASNLWACAEDITTSVTGTGVVTLDLTDDGSNESAALGEIATTGDTNSIFTEPSPDKLLINVGLDWPKSDQADSLTSNPTDCAANQFAQSIVANGNLTCASVVTGDITDGTILEVDLSAIDAAVDEECLTFESPGFEWQPCGSSAANSFETIDTPSGTDPVADSSTDTLQLLAGDSILITGNSGSDSITFTVTGVYTTVLDEGSSLTQRRLLNFVGNGVSCTDDDPRTTCTITQATQSVTGSFTIIDTSSGTDPITDSGSDTLFLVGTLPITVTGDASTDTVTFDCPTCVTSVTGGVGIDSTGGTTPSISFNSTELTSLTWSNGGSASIAWTFNIDTGTDPVLTFSDGIVNVSTGTLQQGGVDVVLESRTITSGAGLAGGGDLSADRTLVTASGETDFLASGALTCGAGTQGRMQVHTTPLQYCDNDGGDTLRYAAYGSSTGVATSATALAANGANCSAGNAPLGVDASGAVEGCFDVEEEANIGTTVITGNAADDQVLIGSAANAATWSSVPDCNTNNRDRIQYDTGTNAFSCDSDTFGTADVAGLDISDDTNLTAGRSLTLTGDDVAADAELFTRAKSINILNPTTTETNKIQHYYATAVTITRVACSTDVATSTVTIQFDERAEATPNTAGTNVMTSSLVCDTDSQTTTSFTNATIAADVPVNLQITATANTPTVVRIHVEFTVDE